MTSRALLAVLLAVLLALAATATASCAPPARAPSSAGAPSPAADASVLFEERFDGPELDRAMWNTCHWWDDGGCTIDSNDELEWYLPSQVAVRDGALHLTAERVETTSPDGDVFPFRSGMVSTGPPRYEEPPRFAFTYGTVDVRLRAPAGRGFWSAFWLLPADSSSRPEIDMLEVLGHDPGLNLMHLHPSDRSEDAPRAEYRLPGGATFDEGWHDIRLEWTRDELRFFVDGKLAWAHRGDDVPDEPMYLVTNLAVGGEYPGSPTAETPFPAVFSIDHITVRGDGG